MTWPTGVETIVATWSDGFSGIGTAAQTVTSLEVVAPDTEYLLWAATGEKMHRFMDGNADHSYLIAPVDQPGWVDDKGNPYTNWYYVFKSRSQMDEYGRSLETVREFQPIMGESPIDLDRLTADGVSAPIVALRLPVKTVNGYPADEDGNVTVPVGSGAAGHEYAFQESSQWTMVHGLARRPSVSLYLGDEEVEADVFADATHFTATFPNPVSGTAVLI